jgi:hypothetical protein
MAQTLRSLLQRENAQFRQHHSLPAARSHQCTRSCLRQQLKKNPLAPSHQRPGETRSRTVLRSLSREQLPCRIMAQRQKSSTTTTRAEKPAVGQASGWGSSVAMADGRCPREEIEVEQGAKCSIPIAMVVRCATDPESLLEKPCPSPLRHSECVNYPYANRGGLPLVFSANLGNSADTMPNSLRHSPGRPN